MAALAHLVDTGGFAVQKANRGITVFNTGAEQEAVHVIG
jgi:hypothetical protein